MKFSFTLILLCLCACDNRYVYDSIQANRANECNKLSGSQREQCLKQLPPDYDTYQRQREELLKK